MGKRTKARGKSSKRRDRNVSGSGDDAILFDPRAAFARVIAEPINSGRGWQKRHEPGAPVVVGYTVSVGTGGLGFPVPLPSELLLRAAQPHLANANRLRKRVLDSASSRDGYPPDVKFVTDHDLIFTFFQEAMAGISLVYAALNNFANEHIPRDFQTDFKGDTLNREDLMQRGIELRLSKVLAEVTGRENLRRQGSTTWSRVLHLKELRDGIEHANGGVHAMRFGADADDTVFAKLLNEPDFTGFAGLVREVIDTYRTGEEGPTAIETPEGSRVTVVSARRFRERADKN